MEEYDDFKKNLVSSLFFLEDRLEKYDKSDLPKVRDLTEDLKGFYENSLKTAKLLRDKMIGKQGYDNECQYLADRIDEMRKLINALENMVEKVVNRLKQDNP